MRRIAFTCVVLAAGCFYDYNRLRQNDAGDGTGGHAGGAGTRGAAGSAGGAAGTGGPGGTTGTGGSATGRGGTSAAGTGGSAGGTAGSGGTAGTGGTAGAGGTGGTGMAGTGGGGIAGTGGGAAGRGGTGGTGGGVAGRGGTGGTGGSVGGRGGTSGTGGSAGRGGAGGAANCVDAIKLNGYAYPPAAPCSACTDTGSSRETQCKAMIDCLESNYPCTGNCYTTCRNASGVSGPVDACVQALTTAACDGASGTAGRGGTTGSGGTTGTGGTGGANACPLGGVLDCTPTGRLTLAPDGLVTDFSDWNMVTAKFCDAHGLDGALFQYAGTVATSSATVDGAMRNLKFSWMVTAGQYAGGGLQFDSCVDASTFNALQFTAAVTSGTLVGCTWQVQLQTQDQRPTTATNPSGGTCSTSSNCYQFPATTIPVGDLTTAPMTMTVPFAGFNNPSGSGIPAYTQIVGLQWQANSLSGTGTCTADVRIDDIKFVTQ